jgi:hypothetical protein
MGSFAGLVEEAFKRVELRAREIGAFLTDASQATAGLIEQQFGEIRTNTSKERERTATALRLAYEQTNTELTTTMQQATERFEIAAAEMRGMARTIQEELDATREEVRRSVADLPQETAEQAATMRRVVFDQIKALNALTEIVTRSGRSLDIAEPPAGAVSHDRTQAGFRRQEVTGAPAAPLTIPDAPPALRRELPQQREIPQRVIATPPAAVARPAQAPTDARGSGWLSDLLARASRDELETPAARAPVEEIRAPIPRGPARPAQPAALELETISLDISRMIDADAAADAWDRYRRGEVEAFSQNVYTARGQQTYEEIRRRYRSDSEFHKTVDRYVKEFERLLSEVNRDDRDDTITRSYLASETGRVYTLLAHAAGRLA